MKTKKHTVRKITAITRSLLPAGEKRNPLRRYAVKKARNTLAAKVAISSAV
ncbi:MAG: hypothetical protein NC180_05670 [Muribaculaceae bacterium]|nr:hypothetical protein [Muribaculaceae bacterium]MCM1492693.1 hypothetical protein [Muribaculaceae bacterium]